MMHGHFIGIEFRSFTNPDLQMITIPNCIATVVLVWLFDFSAAIVSRGIVSATAVDGCPAKSLFLLGRKV